MWSTGFQFRLFYCSFNASLFELWHVSINTVETNLHALILKIYATKNDGKFKMAY